MESLNLDRKMPIPETVTTCGSVLLPIFESYLNGNLPTVSDVRQKIVQSLSPYVNYTIDDNPPNDNEDSSLIALDENYQWKERCADFDADDILDSIIEKINNETNITQNHTGKSPEERDELKLKIFNDYLESNQVFDSLTSFAKDWVEKRESKLLKGELNYSPDYIVKIIREGLENGLIAKTLSPGGGEKK